MAHHALLLIGERASGLAKAYALFDIDEEERVHHPDIHVFCYERFGIDESRMLRQLASRLPVKSSTRSFFVCVGTMTLEAQNALLKLFEEPPRTARFALVIERESLVIPTLRSRMERVVAEGGFSRSVAEAFLALSPDRRYKEIADRVKEKDDAWARDLLSGLEELFSAKPHNSVLRALVFARQYIDVRGSSPKMLLEHVTAALPAARAASHMRD